MTLASWLILALGVLFAVPGLQAAETLQVIVEGISGEERANVAAVLELPHDIVKDGKIDRFWLRRFERQIPGKVREALEPFGYYDPRADVSTEPGPEGVHTITVQVVPGTPVHVTGVEVKLDGPGSAEADLEALIAAFPLRRGDILRQDLYERAKEELQNKALSLGYLGAEFSEHRIAVSLAASSAEILLVLRTGPRYRFGKTTFLGAPLYPEPFLRRYLDYKEGEIFSYVKMARTQYNLVGADRFREVTVNAVKEAAKDDVVPVEVKLTPMPPKRIRFGIGFGTDTGVRGTMVYKDVNFRNSGHSLQAELTASQVLQGVAARYTVADNKDFKTFWALTAGWQHEKVESKETEYVYVQGEHTRTFGFEKIGSFFVQVQKEDSTAGNEQTKNFLVMPGIRFSRRHYDNPTRPTKGYYYEVEARGTDQALGSGIGFVQFLSGGEALFPLPYRFSFFTRARFCATALNESNANLPISVRFFAGGDRSVRGYRYQSLGPTDIYGDVVGGNNLVVGSLELEKAVGRSWGVAAFYDTGNAFNSFSDMNLAQGAGLGVRYYTPIGPVRLDLARQIGIQNPGYRVHFTIGLWI
jgi:translocation and assembly module TamA